uniref:glucan endo-1,3-beta-glucosidase-like n=1 Tax=Erigeron canadensis TaxID=72917 RepID=UPI001CB8C23C|nr:glucan endo-1,3-beta-glucosidase-like [Erigeron canadensis]
MCTPKHPSFYTHLVITFLLLAAIPTGISIGVNYGTLGDNLPPPSQVAHFLKTQTTIDRVKIFDVNTTIIKAFANTGILVSVTVPNGDIPSLTDQRNARRWIDTNIKPYYPATKIHYICVGTEVLHWGPQTLIDNLVPAMKVLHAALVKQGFDEIKISSPHSLGILLASDPPSSASFRPGWDVGSLSPMLEFLKQTKSGFMVNPYTYFGWSPGNSNFCLFKPNPGLFDKATGITYTNQFDQLMDAVHVSMKKLGYPDVEIVVAETGWPSGGDPANVHANPTNAAAYIGGLMKKVSSGDGTPLMPGRKFETYIFALFNENLKGPSLDEKNFGLFRPDFTQVYNVGIMHAPLAPSPSPMAVTADGPSSSADAPSSSSGPWDDAPFFNRTTPFMGSPGKAPPASSTNAGPNIANANVRDSSLATTSMSLIFAARFAAVVILLAMTLLV